MTTEATTAHPGLQEWANAHEPDKKLIYAQGYWNQVIFVRDRMTGILSSSYEQYKKVIGDVRVIGSHHSKSVELPVYQITLDCGAVITMRYNFYDWKVSISSPNEVKFDFMELTSTSDVIDAVYCEGFPKALVYGSYEQNPKQFTVSISTEHKLYAFMWLFSHLALGIREPQRG